MLELKASKQGLSYWTMLNTQGIIQKLPTSLDYVLKMNEDSFRVSSNDDTISTEINLKSVAQRKAKRKSPFMTKDDTQLLSNELTSAFWLKVQIEENFFLGRLLILTSKNVVAIVRVSEDGSALDLNFSRLADTDF